MLNHLHIKNFVLIENLTIDFHSGFNVLTGETGAGKSIVVDAIELALGGRATQIIRQENQHCDITLTFDLSNNPIAQHWLIENNFISDNECIIRRIITEEKSRTTINGYTCSLNAVRELSTHIINIHGQHEQQFLLKSDKQRDLLDTFAKNEILRKQINMLYQEWHDTKARLNELLSPQNNQQAKIDLLRYQINELQDLALKINEVTELEQEYKQKTNAGDIQQHCKNALQILSEDFLYNAHKEILATKDYEPKLNNVVELLNQGLILTKEAVSELQDYLDSTDIDHERIQWIENRLDKIYQVARKHHVQPNKLIIFIEKLAQELHILEHRDTQIELLQKQIATLEKNYADLAEQLSQQRKNAAEFLNNEVSKKMHLLGMKDGKFVILFEKIHDITAHGQDKIEFQVCTNSGQNVQALNKIVSGGELSRIALAIQVISAQKENTPTLIFDEIDVGIGGGTAEIVGKLLKTLGKKVQVFSVTHLPQVAAQADQHFQVSKKDKDKKTRTEIVKLDSNARVKEIARMLGGVKITESSLAHAKEMLAL